jgi:hypothetical protein
VSKERLPETGWQNKVASVKCDVYVSSGVIESGSYLDNRWPSKVKLKDKWFEVAN